MIAARASSAGSGTASTRPRSTRPGSASSSPPRSAASPWSGRRSSPSDSSWNETSGRLLRRDRGRLDRRLRTGPAAARDRAAEAHDVRGGRVPAVRGAGGQGRRRPAPDRDRRDGQGGVGRGASSRVARRSTSRRSPQPGSSSSRRRRSTARRSPSRSRTGTSFTFTEKLIKKQTADFEGVVRDRHTKQPMANVRVAGRHGARGADRREGQVQDPRHRPGRPPGHALGRKPRDGGHDGDVRGQQEDRRDLRGRQEEGEGRRRRRGRGDRRHGARASRSRSCRPRFRRLRPPRCRARKGDVLKVVENLPGVARAAAGSSSLVVWGSAPQDTRVYVDGVHVPLLYHGGGYRSILPSNFVKSVELVAGRLRAELRPRPRRPGDRGDAAPRRGGRSRQRGRPTSSTPRPTCARSCRTACTSRSACARATSTQSSRTSPPRTSATSCPSRATGTARLGSSTTLRPHETIEFGAFASSDRIANTLLNPDPSLTTQPDDGDRLPARLRSLREAPGRRRRSSASGRRSGSTRRASRTRTARS